MASTIDRLLESAVRAHVARNLAEAEPLYRQVLAGQPGHFDATLMLGILLAQSDREGDALPLLEEAAKRDPANFEALKWLSNILSFLKRYEGALSYSKRMVNLAPRHFASHLGMATALFGLERFEEAATAFHRVIELNRNFADAYYGLSTTYLRLGLATKAREVLREAASIAPGEESYLKLGEVCLACEDADEAIRCANRVLRTSPDSVSALILLSRACRIAHRGEEEASTLDRVLEIEPGNALALALRGRRLQSVGAFAAAEEDFRKSIARNPDQGIGYYGIVAGRRMDETDRDLVLKMEEVAANGSLSDDETAHLRYALGKAHENFGDYGQAMRNFDEGNRLMRRLRMGTRVFDRAEMSRQIDASIRLFTRDFVKAHLNQETSVPTPLFIAGIMRSGTTLVEQILSCHPQIGAGGEQSFWRPAEYECVDHVSGRVDMTLLCRKAEEFTSLLAGIAPGFPVVTDKNPANRMVYGLIHMAFPGARIIHMKRNPVDVAISIYTTLIRTGAQFMGDKDDIVFALAEHERMAAHWKSVLPKDRLLEVVYEDLIEDREGGIRQMLEFCGVPWDEGCLRPEMNERTVVTPSFWQVRQPVYKSSRGRWKNYEPWLGPFRQLLDRYT